MHGSQRESDTPPTTTIFSLRTLSVRNSHFASLLKSLFRNSVTTLKETDEAATCKPLGHVSCHHGAAKSLRGVALPAGADKPDKPAD